MTAIRILAWLSLAAPVLAQTGMVEGRVISTAGGRGVPKARVVLRSKSEAYSAVTDKDGAFRVIGVEAGTYTASADRTGWAEERLANFQLLPGQRVADLALRLTPTGVIAGRVLDADGDPLSRVMVQALQVTYSRGRRTLFPFVSATTNDRGEYRLFGLRPGTYYVRTASRMPAEASTYYPSGNSSIRAAELELPPGAEIGSVDIRVSSEPTYGLTIRLSQPMSPAERAQLSLRISGLGPDPPGNFALASGSSNEVRVFKLNPGRYVAMAQKPDPQSPGTQLYWQRSFEIANADVDLAAVFRPAGEVSGTVEGAAVKVSRLELSPEDPAMLSPSPVIPAGGAFTFRVVMPDVYTLRVTAAEGAYLKAVYAGDRKLESQRIDLGRVSGRLRVVLGADGGELSGLAVDADGRPVPQAPIALAPVQADWPDLVRTAIADENGNFRLEDIAPGSYRLFAWKTAPAGAPECPEFRAPYEPNAFPIDIEANADRRTSVTVLR
jgi:large repetitive protein